MAAPYFLVTNKLRGATILSEDTAAGFGFSNALDGRTSTQAGFEAGGGREVVFDFGAAQVISHIGMAGHTLAGLNVAIHSSANGSDWTMRLSFVGQPGVYTYELSAPFSDRYFRITITPDAGIAYVSDFFAGQATELPYGIPHGFVPPEQGDQDTVETNMTGRGALVGIAVTRKPKRTRVTLQDYHSAWFESNWSELIETMKQFPVYFLWAAGKRAFFCTLARQAPQPAYNTNIRQSATLDLEGFVD